MLSEMKTEIDSELQRVALEKSNPVDFQLPKEVETDLKELKAFQKKIKFDYHILNERFGQVQRNTDAKLEGLKTQLGLSMQTQKLDEETRTFERVGTAAELSKIGLQIQELKEATVRNSRVRFELTVN